jgi:hypothetical protein
MRERVVQLRVRQAALVMGRGKRKEGFIAAGELKNTRSG